MHPDTIEMIVLAVAVIAFVTIRQTRWSPVTLATLFLMPLIFGLVGVVMGVQAVVKPGGLGHLGGRDLAVIAIELALGVVAGSLMGRQTEIATVNGVTRSRLRPVGLAIWLGFMVYGSARPASGRAAATRLRPVRVLSDWLLGPGRSRINTDMRIQLADRCGGRNGTQRFAVRFFGTAFLGYVLATQGASPVGSGLPALPVWPWRCPTC